MNTELPAQSTQPQMFTPSAALPHDGPWRLLATHHRRAAFTLVELLAIVVVLGLGAAMLAPAMARTHSVSPAFVCLNNLRQLLSAWKMYADDNNGKLVYNRDGGNAGKSASDNAWVGGWLDFSPSSDNTNVDLLINHTKYPFAAYFGPYLKTASVFKCPADRSRVTIAGDSLPRVRSVSMNNLFGTSSHTWSGFGAVYTKTYQIQKPASLFVILDEREDSINEGVFNTNPDTRFNMIDFPAAYHEGAGGFAFADGHGEIHHWQDPRTAPVLHPGMSLPLNVMLINDPDVDWLHSHARSAP